ncbi:MFS transporter [Aspergillus tanneri]|uniref:Major facilitator superfamily (MFS) profile domain-containing protein n=1 Tax=Aspergillus tanneri TaxID=1220188 RepID=A0A5M9MV56_9EURO|nr:uncharacterized protein ATNIH1004_004384 [Aspergillus tanneri]KAA8648499.1 hypothetical protein ATNIH1004_004384 [Aspergillus tanneri]
MTSTSEVRPMVDKLQITGESKVTSGTAASFQTDSLDDHIDPKKWPLRRKWKAMLGISSFVLMSPLSSTIVAPSLPSIARDLSISQPAEQSMVLSIFVLPYAFGPLIAGPLSEMYGRVRVIQSWNLLYLVFNTACGAAPSKSAMLAFRFLAGFFGSATLGIGGGTLSDLFTAEERGKAVAIYSVIPLLSPVIGPIVGGFIAQHISWHWAFYIASLLDVIIQILGIYFLEETYVPVLLHRKQMHLMRTTALDHRLHSKTREALKGLRSRLRTNLGRAALLLTTQPIVQVFALYNAFLYGIIYILYTIFPDLYTEVYHESEGIVGLHYLSMGVGMTIAAQGFTYVNDRIFASLKTRYSGVRLPEFRVPPMGPATLLLAGGLFWYGWSAQYKLHWIMPDIGSGLFCIGAVVCGISANAYIIDTYGKFSASALAAVGTLRSLTAFGFPLFAPYIFKAFGYGWAGSLLGFCALGIGLPCVAIIWFHGNTLRRRSTVLASDGEGSRV